METAILNTNGLGRIVLTDNGKVIGLVTMRRLKTISITGEESFTIDFTGRAVNLIYGSNHGFGAGLSIGVEDPETISNSENFLNSLEVKA